MANTDSITSVSLLMRIRADDRDPRAWQEFVDRYGSRIFAWARNRQLSAEDAQEVTQEVLVKLCKRLGTFNYDPSMTFRGWLRRVTENAIKDFVKDNRPAIKRMPHGGAMELLHAVESREDLRAALEEAFDLELFERAVDRVRHRVTSERFRIWSQIARNGRSAPEVAAELNLKIATVYSARHYVQSLIQEEIQTLEGTTIDATRKHDATD